MHWKFQKPASASPTTVSRKESYAIVVQAILSKKTSDRWIIVKMGKPLLSEAVSLILFAMYNKTKCMTFSHGPHLGS
jgi:hypothetical protein